MNRRSWQRSILVAGDDLHGAINLSISTAWWTFGIQWERHPSEYSIEICAGPIRVHYFKMR